jgi:hypothetical protein
VIRPKGMSETDLKIRTMTIDLPGVGELGSVRGVTPSTEEAIKFREEYKGATKMVSSLDKLLEYANEGRVFNPSDRAVVDSLVADVIGASRLPVLGPGVMTDSEREWLSSLIGNPNRMMKFNSTTKAQLNRWKDNAIKGVSAYATSLGLQVAGGGSGDGGNGPQRTVINVEDLKGY